MKWRLLTHATYDPKLNLATEEAILRSRHENLCPDTLWIWQNRRSVVLGRFCDIKSEVNVEACMRNGVEIVRRTSGGGAVYHDLGNLNFSMITKPQSAGIPNSVLAIYKWSSEAVLGTLQNLGVGAEFKKPNSLLVNGKKVSGLAQYWFYDALLLHGTLMVDVDVRIMYEVLSNLKNEVVNISLATHKHLTIDEVRQALATSFSKILGTKFQSGNLVHNEFVKAKELYDVKYSRDDWNL